MANLEVLALDEATPQIRAPGSGDGYTMPRPVAMNPGTLTTDIKVLDLAATWNGGAVTFTGMKFNVTDTASAAASLLVDLQVGGTSKVSINKSGQVNLPNTCQIDTTTANFINFIITGTTKHFSLSANFGPKIISSRSYNWCSTSNSETGTVDLSIYRDAANILAQRNDANAQTSRVYRTYTDASNYQRLTQTWSTSTAVIHNEGAGTGADGSVAFNDAALATDATKGFVMIPSCAGTPTGTPADIPTGQVPIVFDSTNNKLYVYDGGWIATAALT